MLFIVLLGQLSVHGQSVIKELESRRGTLLRQIKESEELLNTTSRDVSGQLNALSTLTAQIDDRQRYIQHLTNDMQVIDRELRNISRQLERLELDLKNRKESYAASLRQARQHNKVEEQLLFVFSAPGLAQSYRRARYLREYTDFQRVRADEIIAKQKEIAERKVQLEATREEKNKILAEWDAENKRLQEQQEMQRALVAKLQTRQKGIQDELAKQRRQAGQLNDRIDKLIAEEIARAEAEAQAEARAEAKAEADKKADNKKKSNTPAVKTEKPAPMGSFKLSRADRALSGNFADNRGRLPAPVTGPHTVVSRYGQYNVPGLRNVKLDNKGIDIQTTAGSQAQAVFDGVVSAVFQVQGSGLYNIILRHGDYITVYCNLASAAVAKGDRVKTRQPLGVIYSDPNDKNRTVLHFQLRRERQQMNPQPWLELR